MVSPRLGADRGAAGGRLSAVAATAVAIANERAAESARPDALFDDPLAAAFVAAATPPGAAPPPPLGEQASVMGGYVALRTRCFDDELLAAVGAERGAPADGRDPRSAGASAGGLCRQVVLLAAGLDTRAFRLDWPAGTVLFELDVPELLALKEPLLAAAGATARCERQALAIDLRDDWRAPLLAAGFDPALPTAWLAEGLLMYLAPAENDRLLATVGDLSAPGSVLLAEHVPAAGARPPREGEGGTAPVAAGAAGDAAGAGAPGGAGAGTGEDGHVLDAGGASWRSTLDEPLAWLQAHGWTAAAIDAAALADAVGRPLPPVLDPAAVGSACAWLLRAGR